MKNIKYLAIISLFGFLGVSCSLEEKSYTEIDMDEYMNNASEANTVLTGIYADLCEEGMYRYNLSCLLQMPTDMEKCEGSTTDNYRIVPANAYTSVQSDIEITWEDINKAIYDANSFIRQLSLNVENFDEDDKPLATVYMGEARALRALCYFELVRWFGNVTLNTDPMYAYKTPLTEMEQDDPVEVYEQIEKDLLYAVDVLPYATDDNLRASNDYRFSKGAALGLLTKVYATWAGYPLYDESKWELDNFVEVMRCIYKEIQEVKEGTADKADNVLLNAPHPEYEVVANEWNHAYTREKAAYPIPSVRDNKFWINVARVDNTLGDRKLLATRNETF